jgi:hypothetical protein
MSGILSEYQVHEYAEHAANEWIEGSSEREIIELLCESHLSLWTFVHRLEDMNHEKFGALKELALALWKENPAIYESVCRNNDYLNSLIERTGSLW